MLNVILIFKRIGKKLSFFPLCFAFIIAFLVVNCQSNSSTTLTIATAANMQFAMATLTKAFTKETGIPCQITVSSSGKLTAQIQAGAPYDVFVSADMKYPTTLFEGGFATTPPKVYALGKLILWTFLENIPLDVDSLTMPTIRHIAIANPKTAPYGKAAMKVLQQTQLISRVTPKLVYGESIAQTNQFITSKAAEVGFTTQSVVLSSELKDKGHWKAVDTAYYTPIQQGVVVLKNDRLFQQQAKAFTKFLFSDTGQAILKTYGYEVKNME